MSDQTSKPTWISDQELEAALIFLDELRESGTTNMYGARPYMQEWWAEEYGNDLEDKKAIEVLLYWMKTFRERHKVAQP